MFLIPQNLKLHELFNKKHKIIWSLKIGTTISVFILHSLVVPPIPSDNMKTVIKFINDWPDWF